VNAFAVAMASSFGANIAFERFGRLGADLTGRRKILLTGQIAMHRLMS
jgi:hypothetical protein